MAIGSNFYIIYKSQYGNQITGMYSKARHLTLARHDKWLLEIFMHRENFQMSDILQFGMLRSDVFQNSSKYIRQQFGIK